MTSRTSGELLPLEVVVETRGVVLDNVVERILLPDIDGKSLGEIDILVAFLLDLSVGHVRLHRGDPSGSDREKTFFLRPTLNRFVLRG